jgi:hypothetical protein
MTVSEFTDLLDGSLNAGVRDNHGTKFDANEVGRRKTVRVSLRDDCLLDVNASSVEVDGGEDLDPIWYESDYIAHHQEFYWNKTKQNIEDAFLEDAVDTTVHWALLWEAETGKKKTVQITRRDDGTFDMVVDVLTISNVDGTSISSGEDGIGVTVAAAIGSTTVPTIAPAKRKRHSVSLKVTPEGLYDYSVQETTVKGGVDTKSVGDLTIYQGKDQDTLLTDNLSNPDGSPELVGDGSFRYADDGSVSWGFKTRPLYSDIFELADKESYRSIAQHLNTDTAAIDELLDDEAIIGYALGTNDVLDSFRISPGDNGKWNATISKHALISDSGTLGDTHSAVDYGVNQDAVVDAPGLDVFDGGTASLGENGKFNYALRSHALDADAITHEKATTTPPRKVKYYFGHNEASLPTITDNLQYSSARRGENGTWSYSASEEKVTATTKAGLTERWRPDLNSYGYDDAIEIFRYKPLVDAPKLLDDEYGGYQQLRMEDDGTLSGLLVRRTYYGTFRSQGSSSAAGLIDRKYRTDNTDGLVYYRDTTYTNYISFEETLSSAMSFIASDEGGLYIDKFSVSIQDAMVIGADELVHGYRCIKSIVTAEDADWTLVGTGT